MWHPKCVLYQKTILNEPYLTTKYHLVIGWNSLPVNGNMNKPNEGCRFRSFAWFIMLQQKTVASLSSPKSLAIHCISVLCTLPFLHHPLTFPSYVGHPSIKHLVTSQSASSSSHVLPTTWQLSHLDPSLPSGIIPSFSCSNPSYTALKYARIIFIDDDANSDACLNLITNRNFTFHKENKDDIAVPVYRKLHTINPLWCTACSTVQHIFMQGMAVALFNSMKKEGFEFISLLLFQATNDKASKAMTRSHFQNTQFPTMRLILTFCKANTA